MASSTNGASQMEEKCNTEQLAIQKLRTAITDLIKINSKYGEDWFLLSFLKNHRFNHQKAEAAIRECVKWRVEINFEQMASQDFDPEVYEFIPTYFDCETSQGDPVITVVVGDVDHRGIVAKFGAENYTKFWYQFLSKVENAARLSFQKQKLSNMTTSSKCQAILLIDISNYSLYQARSVKIIQTWLSIARNISRYCSACVYKFHLLNVNRLFKPILKLIKPILEGPSVQFIFFDTNDSNWEEELMDLGIDRAQIRPRFGGTKVD